MISPNSNIRLMSIETALGTKEKCEVKDNRIGVHKKPTHTTKISLNGKCSVQNEWVRII